MRTLKEKLHSSSGASILMALLLLLVALMVSLVILSAAISAVKAVRSDREQQQLYLTVSSAAELIRDSIAGGSAGYQTETVNHFSDPGRKNPLKAMDQEPTVKEASGKLSSIFNEANGQLHSLSDRYAKSFLLHVDGDVYSDVTAEIRMRKSDAAATQTGQLYTMTIVLTAERNGRKCQMLLTANGTQTLSSVDTSEQIWSGYSRRTIYLTTTTRKLTWDTPTITKKEDGA